MYCLTTMYVVNNNFLDITTYSLIDNSEILIETFFFLCTVEEQIP